MPKEVRVPTSQVFEVYCYSLKHNPPFIFSSFSNQPSLRAHEFHKALLCFETEKCPCKWANKFVVKAQLFRINKNMKVLMKVNAALSYKKKMYYVGTKSHTIRCYSLGVRIKSPVSILQRKSPATLLESCSSCQMWFGVGFW